jgi:hypothetical protein
VCTPLDHWHIALFCALVATAAIAALLQHRFVTQLESHSPSVWEQLGKRRVWADDGNRSYAAAQLFLLKGEHTSLTDPALVRLGSRARWAFFVCAGLFLVWFMFAAEVNSFVPRFSCLFA